jgi:hypothetical protein
MDDQNIPSEPVAEAPVQAPEPAPAPVEPESSQPNGSTPTDLPPEAPEPPTSDSASIPVEDQNPGLNQPESVAPEPAPDAPQAPVDSQSVSIAGDLPPIASQPQSPAQQDQAGFIHGLLVKAQAKIQSNKQKKLELLMQSVLKKGKIDNRETVKLLRISDKTAERYLNKLVAQGRLKRVGAGRDVIYELI